MLAASTLAGTPVQADAVRAESTYVAPNPTGDPRQPHNGEAEKSARKLNDALLWRPFFFVQLIVGVAVFPAAVPIAGAFADWEDAIDICITGPYAMVFERPLGE